MAEPIDLERIYDAHGQALYAYLLNLTRNEVDTRDILQDLFCKLGQKPSLMTGVRDERAFLIRLAHNTAIDAMRRNGTRQKYHAEFGAETLNPFAASDSPDEQGFREALSKALQELPQEQRAVVHLKLWEDQTFEAIAEILNIPPNTAASRYRYGIDKLRERLRPLYDEIQ